MKSLLRLCLTFVLMLWAHARSSAQTWQIPSGTPTNATAIGAASGNTLYAGFNGSNGVYRSTDNGLHWAAVNSGLIDGANRAIPATALFRASSGRILRGGANASWGNGVGSPVFYSDNGTSWTQVPYPFATPSSNPAGVAASDFEQIGGTLFFSDVLSFGVWRSTDNGVTWDKADNGLPFAPFTGFKFVRALAKSGNALIAMDPVWGPYRSTDNGTSWQAAHLGITAVPSGLFGDTWPGNDVTAVADGTLYAAMSSSSTLYRSTDAGQTWVEVGAGVFSSGEVRRLASLGNSIYAALSTVNGYRIYESTDAGVGWQLMPTNGLMLSGLDVLGTTFLGHSGALYLTGPEGLLRLDPASAVRTAIAPVFVSGTGSVGVNVGDAVSLNAKYGGTTPISYKWYRDGVEVPGATDAVLNISPATTNNAGAYTVVAANTAGSVTNAIGTLTVEGKALGAADYSFAGGFGYVDLFNWNGFFFNAAQVTALARQPDGKAVVGGTFSYAGRGASPVELNGVPRTGIARINADGTVDTSFNAGAGPNVAPDHMAIQPDGKIVVSGDFSTWNGVAVNRLVRFNTDGSIDRTFDIGTGPNGRVQRVLVMPDGKIAICGVFTSFNGRHRGYLAMLNPDGSLSPGFGELSGLNTYAFALAAQPDGKLLVGGDFATADWQSRTRIARYNSDGTLDATFGLNGGPNGRVLNLLPLPDGRIFVGGAFNSVNGASRARMAILSSTGAVDANFIPGSLSRDVLSSAVLGTNAIAVGGENGLLAAFDFNGTLLWGGVSGVRTTWAMAEEPDGRFLAASGSTSFGVLGRLARYFGVNDRNGIVRNPTSVAVNAGGNASFSVGVRSASPVTYRWLKNGNPLGGQTSSNLTFSPVGAGDAGNYSVIVSNSALVVTSAPAQLTVLSAPVIVQGLPNRILSVGYPATLAVEAAGQSALTYEWKKNGVTVPGATNNYLALASPQFSDSGAYSVEVRNGLGAATNSAQITVSYTPGNLDLAWALTTNPGNTVTNAGVGPDGKLYIAGSSGNRIYRFNTNGTIDNSFTATNIGTVSAMILQPDGKVLVAHGAGITRLNTNGTWDSSWTNQGFTGGGSAKAWRLALLGNGQLLAFGNFAGYGAFTAAKLVRLNADGSPDTSYKPLPSTEIPNPALFAARADGTVFLGVPVNANGFSGSYQFHRLLPDGTRDPSYAPFFDNEVKDAQALPDGALLAVGRFSTVNGENHPVVARVLADGNIDASFTSPFKSDAAGVAQVTRALVQPNGKVLLTGNFTSISNFLPASGITRLNADGSLDLKFRDISGAATVNAEALFPDGRIAIAGGFSTANTISRANVAVLQGDLVDPAFVVSPVGQTVVNGANVILRASASSLGGVNYQWYRNGQVLSGQTGSTLNLNAVTASDSGNYTVIAISATGTNSSSAELLVLGAPVIVQQPVAGEFWVGSTNSLAVRAVGAPALSYQWSKGGSPIGYGTNATLTLTNAQTVDSGSYVVTISNGLGTTNSVAVQVNVVPRPGMLVTTWQAAEPAAGSGSFTDVQALPDGKFLVCGNDIFGNSPYFLRLNSDGSVDGTFNAGLATGNGTGNLRKFELNANNEIYLQRSATIQRHGVNGALDANFNFRGISGTTVPLISDIAVAPNGRVVVGGAFLNYGGLPARHLIRLNVDGSLDGGFAPNMASNVTAVAVLPDGKVLAGMVLGVGAPGRLVRLMADGSVDPTFSTNTVAGTLFGGTISKILPLPDGRIYVGGNFTVFGGAPAGGLVRLFENGSRDFSFVTPSDALAVDIAVQGNGRLVVAGMNANKAFRRYNTDGSLDAKFMMDDGAVSSGTAYAVAIDPSGRILAGGTFNAWNINNSQSYSRRGLALLNGDPIDLFIYQHPKPQFVNLGSTATFIVGVTGAAPVSLQWRKNGTNLVGQSSATLQIPGAQLSHEGFYSVIATSGGLSRTSFVAQLAVLGAPEITSQPAGVDAYYQENAVLNVGAEGALPLSFQWRRGGAALDSATNSLLALTNLQFSAAGSYDVIVSNSFGSVTSDVATVTVSIRQGSRDTTFVPGTAPSSAIQQLITLADGRSYLAGNFTMVGGQNRRYAALINADGSVSSTFSNNAYANGSVNAAIAQSDGKLVLGGTFTLWDSFYSQYLVRFLTNGTIDTNFTARLNPGPDNTVSLLAVGPDDSILVAGNFGKFNDEWRTNLARIKANGSFDYSFDLKTNLYVATALLVQPDRKILFGNASVGALRLNADGSRDTDWSAPAFNSGINAFALQQDGKVLVGGQFTPSLANPNGYITRLNADGTLDDTFNSGTNVTGAVSQIAVQEDGRILIAGSFFNISGQSRNYFARLNADGSLDTSFQPGTGSSGGSPSNPLIGLQYQGRIVLAGGFTSYDGSSSPYLVGINGQTNDFAITNQPVARTVNAGESVSFHVGVFGPGPVSFQWLKNGVPIPQQTGSTLALNSVQSSDAAIYSVAVTSGMQVRTSRPAALTVLGKPVFISSPGSVVAQQGSSVTFSAFAEGAEPIEFAWQKNGAAISGETNRVLTLGGAGIADAGLYTLVVANGFGAVTSSPAVLSVNLLPAGALDSAFGTNGPNSEVRAATVDSTGALFIAGVFSYVDGKYQQYVAKLTPAGTLDTNYAPAIPDSYVQTIALQPDGKLLIGGYFSTVGGIARRGIARLNTNGSLDMTFSNALNVNGYVYSIALHGSDKILIGGQFNSVDGVSRANLARLNANGSLDGAWGAGDQTDGYVQSISVQADDRILIGGGFSKVRGVTKRQVARLNDDGTIDATFDVGNGPNFSPSVQVVRALPGGQVMVGGTFSSFNSAARSLLVRLDSTGVVDTNFNSGINGSIVNDVQVQPDGNILVGGNFSLFHNSTTARGIMRFLTNGVADTVFQPGTGVNSGGSVNTIALADSGTVIGGSFSSYAGIYKPYIARVFGDGPTAPVVSITPGSVTAQAGVDVFFGAVASGLGPLKFQWRKDGTNLPGQTNTFLALKSVQSDAVGDYTVVVTNSVGSVTSLAATLTFDGAGGGFSSWASSSGLTSGNNGPGDDPDLDGIPNLFEFYFGTLPLNNSDASEPFFSRVSTGAEGYPAITFIRSQSATGVGAVVRVSSSLQFTDSLGSVIESIVDLGNGKEAVTIRSSASIRSQPSQFLRLELTEE